MIELLQSLLEILTILRDVLDKSIEQINRKKLKSQLIRLLELEIISLKISIDNSIKSIQKLNAILEDINNLKEPEKEAEMLACEISNNVNKIAYSLSNILKIYSNHKEEFHKVLGNDEAKIFLDGLANTFKADNGRYSIDFDTFIDYLIYGLRSFEFKKEEKNVYIGLSNCIFNICFRLLLNCTNDEDSKKYMPFINTFNKKINECCPILNELGNAILKKFQLLLDIESILPQ
ncbi:hypothetical protein JH146_0331 [Methanocaldococcus bathoardescens]|uniref:Uncharacterized protein n=1 Tax=Methanocaldococcus bathoardescens TaxID=1301915 RepID=A0A076LAG6_9EURY|nr:hypothetical protein [Methanocaldococcus bathoardescens]AIJ05181.1 hypothetical protein JH146_0331 [Methanocaldococcus bathoardescens]